MKKSKVRGIVVAGIIAALYVVLTELSAVFGLSSGVIQVRFSEALCVLPLFTPAAVPGMYIGCVISNVLTGANLFDVIFGGFATLIGALGTYIIGVKLLPKSEKYIFAAPLPEIISNVIILPFVFKYAYGWEDAMWFSALTVGIGEIISAGVMGMLLLFGIKKYAKSNVL